MTEEKSKHDLSDYLVSSLVAMVAAILAGAVGCVVGVFLSTLVSDRDGESVLALGPASAVAFAVIAFIAVFRYFLHYGESDES